MPEPGSMADNLVKAVERVAAADAKVQQLHRDTAAQAVASASETALPAPTGPGGAVSPTQPAGGRQ